MPAILIVGAADTGRAPITVALLRRLLRARGYGWEAESAGVLGHDGAEAETEARDTMVHMGLDIGEHRARSLDGTMVAQAALIVAIDGGAARVIRARFPDAAGRAFSLGELAGRPRDIPDPFRMQIGAWMTYAREIERMLEAALPRLAELLPPNDLRQTTDAGGGSPGASPASAAAGETGQGTPGIQVPPGRATAAARIAQLLQVAAQMPGVVDWAAARGRIEADLAAVAQAPSGPGDLVAAYVGLLRAALGLLPAAPSAGQLAALHEASARLSAPIGQPDLNDLSSQLAALPSLA
jgi:protein-tyrosine-phosphatase